MRKVKPKSYHLEIYRQNYIFCIGMKRKDFASFMKSRGIDFVVPKQNSGLTLHLVSGLIVVYTEDKKPDTDLIHEITHAAVMTLNSVGISVDGDQGEALAYLIGHLYEKAKGLK